MELGNPAGLIWDAVMTDIHKPLEKAKFVMPSGIVEETACKASGCIASSGCGDTYTEIFSSDNIPEACEGHGSQKICTESGLIATPYCPNTKTNYYGSVLMKEKLKLWKPLNGTSASGTKISGVCNIHTQPADVQEEATPAPKHDTEREESTPKPKASPTAPPATPKPAATPVATPGN